MGENVWTDWLIVVCNEWHPSLSGHISPLYTAGQEESFIPSAVWQPGTMFTGHSRLKTKVLCCEVVLMLYFTSYCCVLRVRITPWTCSSARCGLMSGWNSRDQLKSCGSTTAWWKRSGYRTRSSETQRGQFLTTWRRQTSCSVSCRMGPSSTRWGDLTLDGGCTSSRKKVLTCSFLIGSLCHQADNQCRLPHEVGWLSHGRPRLPSPVRKL